MSDWFFIGDIIKWIFGDNIPDLSFVDMEKSETILGFGGIADNITINLGQLQTSGIAESTDNGQSNTQAIYNFEGIQLVNEIINRIQDMSGYTTTTTGEGVIPTNNAAIACMKLNSWNILEANDESFLTLTNDNNLADWYLPATNEISGISDEEYPLDGNYWTSTAVSGDHEYAYKYTAGGSTSQERRDSELHVRAVRKKPAN